VTDTPPDSCRRLTPGEVLHALRHFAQFDSDYPWADPSAARVGFETTIREFDRLRGTDGPLGRYLNGFFGTAVSDAEWKAVLTPARDRTVADLCHFLSERAYTTPMPAYSFLGRPCPAGAVFLALRDRLAAAGVDVRRLAPSTPLRLRSFWGGYEEWPIIPEAVRIAPGRLPLREPTRGAAWFGCYQLSALLLVAAAVGLACLGIVPQVWAVSACAGLLAVTFCVGLALTFLDGPNRFAGLRTFRDLCKQLAGEPVSRQSRLQGV
jgi:hypothetical protein